jgi:hypothetical protein
MTEKNLSKLVQSAKNVRSSGTLPITVVNNIKKKYGSFAKQSKTPNVQYHEEVKKQLMHNEDRVVISKLSNKLKNGYTPTSIELNSVPKKKSNDSLGGKELKILRMSKGKKKSTGGKGKTPFGQASAQTGRATTKTLAKVKVAPRDPPTLSVGEVKRRG